MKINIILKPRIGKKKLHMVQRTDLRKKKEKKNLGPQENAFEASQKLLCN
jgi:hypothetical protein